MRTCSACRSDVPDAAESCPGCGAFVSRGFLASLGALFRGRKEEPAPAPRAAPAMSSSGEGFSLTVEDVFGIAGRGTVVTGRVAHGSLTTGEEITFRSPKGELLKCRVIGIEMIGKIVAAAKAGDSVGLVLSKVRIEDLALGTKIERA